ncbi:MAG: sigma-70 family RNA polymerase sigma factor [Ruminococcus sp.]|jgi:RNA polymerase sporulation-specific sigma factor|nr:sigma-70 family RNA polymerase sigma factor [Ruminococcus sp.]MBQ1602149.1 sigma-70 family RNA polymerase sigma factor [Ruminococcus sp.]MBQ1639348.1 sigma-70 family RNA polymerase sigma factor [Ruminococcus sp.]MBQ1686599.1 sigma-70 family RNA polymerase sigma factor [Ruminococcus sp.]MBQ1944005.1 sigma-70 family RNA polymerase sigma factor [Ruminococcus sp.]
MAHTKGLYSTLSDDVLAEFSKNGDDNAFNELAIRYLNKIRFIARKYSAQGYEQNDFVQEGLMALLYACKTYDVHGGSSFGNFVSLIVERRFISIFRSSQSKKAVPDAMLVRIDGIGEELTDYVATPEEQLVYKEQLGQVLKRLHALLSAREYEVLMLFASGLSYSKISQQLNISEKSVDNALQRARRKVGANDMS